MTRQPVLLQDATEAAFDSGHTQILEISPKPIAPAAKIVHSGASASMTGSAPATQAEYQEQKTAPQLATLPVYTGPTTNEA